MSLKVEMKTAFDIGANNGASCKDLVAKGFCVHAFEPTPFLIETYLKSLESEQYIIVPKAVDIKNGHAKFNVGPRNIGRDGGVSSLHNFSDNLNKTWPGRKEFFVEEQITVETVRMDTYIRDNNIKEIDLFHCDTQGNDLNVLKSFGNQIRKIKSGVVEGANKNPLYKNVENSSDAIQKYLKKYEFEILGIKSNDAHGNEVNIYFKKV